MNAGTVIILLSRVEAILLENRNFSEVALSVVVSRAQLSLSENVALARLCQWMVLLSWSMIGEQFLHAIVSTITMTSADQTA